MRPLQPTGTTATPRRGGRGQKAVNGVRKGLVKAKVTAVKAKRKIGADKDEARDLLEESVANGSAVMTPKTPKRVKAARKMQKIKSIVKTKSATALNGLKNNVNGTAEESKSNGQINGISTGTMNGTETVNGTTKRTVVTERPLTPRRSTRSTRANPDPSVTGSNGTTNGVDEVGMEVVEVGPSTSKGLLQRITSRVWKMGDGITGIPYNGVNDETFSEEKVEEDKGKCIIS